MEAMKGHIAFLLSSSSLLSLSLSIPSIASIVFLVGVPLDEGDPLCIGIHSIKLLFVENSRAFFSSFGYLPWFPFLIESLITYFMWMHSSVSCSWHLWNISYFFVYACRCFHSIWIFHPNFLDLFVSIFLQDYFARFVQRGIYEEPSPGSLFLYFSLSSRCLLYPCFPFPVFVFHSKSSAGNFSS